MFSPSENANTESEMRLAAAFERALLAARSGSTCGSDSQLGNRLHFARKLPEFSGNPLDWLHFKEAYESSAELGGYTDRENIARLYSAIKGEARGTVRTLLATSIDADSIIH